MKMHSRWLGDELSRVTSGVVLGAESVVEKYVEVIPSLYRFYDSAQRRTSSTSPRSTSPGRSPSPHWNPSGRSA